MAVHSIYTDVKVIFYCLELLKINSEMNEQIDLMIFTLN